MTPNLFDYHPHVMQFDNIEDARTGVELLMLSNKWRENADEDCIVLMHVKHGDIYVWHNEPHVPLHEFEHYYADGVTYIQLWWPPNMLIRERGAGYPIHSFEEHVREKGAWVKTKGADHD